MKDVVYMKKNNFDKKYPLFSEFILDEQIRKNMLDNKDLYRKYQENEELIKIFIIELKNRFDIETVKNIIIETIFKYPDEILKSYIVSYLNSTETIKNRKDNFNYFKKIMFMGEDIIRYVERNGIITDRGYKNIPEKILDEKYNELKSGVEMFKGELLENIFKTLSFSKKEFIVDLLKIDAFQNFNESLKETSFNLSSILNLIETLGIPAKLFEQETFETLGVEKIRILIVKYIDSSYIENSYFSKNICILLKNSKTLFIRKLIEIDKIDTLNEISNEEVESITFDEKYLESMNLEQYLEELKKNTIRKLKEAA